MQPGCRCAAAAAVDPNPASCRCRLQVRVQAAGKNGSSSSPAAAGDAQYDYDLIIIGCGVGGHGAGLHAVECGMKVAIIEGHDIGGTCVNRGCVPSKALLAASNEVRKLRDTHHQKTLGIQLNGVATFDRQAIADHATNLASTIQGSLQRSLESLGVVSPAAAGVGTPCAAVLSGGLTVVPDSQVCAQSGKATEPDSSAAACPKCRPS